MLGSNPSADSVASTDRQGDASASPFIRFPAENSASGEAPSDKSWGCGGKAPAAYAGHKAHSETGRPLIMRALAISQQLTRGRACHNSS